MTFSDLGLSADVARAVSDAGYHTPTPIQAQAIPTVLSGRDVLGCAQTGTGKTASFTLPMIDILASGRAKAKMPRSLILEPTRELAAQVAENFEKYGKYNKLSMALLIGGVSYVDQEKLLDRGVDVLIATPGRLMDHFERGRIMLIDVKVLVIDEADRMLDMGFIPDIEKIVSKLPANRQTLLFSATMPPEIRRLADAFLSNPKEITVAPPASPAATVAQHVSIVDELDKRETLRRILLSEEVKNAIIFCNRKKDVSILHKSLVKHGLNAAAIHGDLPQSVRTETLDRFKRSEITLLIASDVAARGLDIADLSHVFNFDVPIHAEDYVHRIGRTGRAGKLGRAFTLATPEEGRALTAIESLIGSEIPRFVVDGIPNLEFLADDARKARRRGAPKRTEAAPKRTEDAAAGPSRSPRRRSSAGSESRGAEPRVAEAAAASPATASPATASIEPIEWPPRASTNDRPQRAERPERAERPGRYNAERPAQSDRPQADRAGGERAPRFDREDRDRSGRDDRSGYDRNGPERRPRYRRDEDDGPPVIGLGDHVPAFLLRPVRIAKVS